MGRLGFLLYHMAMLDFRISIYLYIYNITVIYITLIIIFFWVIGDLLNIFFPQPNFTFFPAWFVPIMWEACRFGALEDIGEMALSRMRHD